MGTPVCEDADVISARLKELEAERRARFECMCAEVVAADGNLVRLRSLACPVHKPEAETPAALMSRLHALLAAHHLRAGP